MTDISPYDDPLSGVLPQADGSAEAPTASPAAPAPHALIRISGIDPPSETNDWPQYPGGLPLLWTVPPPPRRRGSEPLALSVST
jgi:hypothetical protein